MSKRTRAMKKVKKVSELKIEAMRQLKSLTRCLNSKYFRSEEFRNINKYVTPYIEEGKYREGGSIDLDVLDTNLTEVDRAFTKLVTTLDELQERTGVK